MHLGRQRSQPDAVALARKSLEGREGRSLGGLRVVVLGRLAAVIPDLEKHAVGTSEGRHGLRVREDLDGLVDAAELLGPKARPLGPGGGTRFARELRLVEE